MLLCISKWMHIVTYIAYDNDCNYAKYSRGSYWRISKPPVFFLFNKKFVGNNIFFSKMNTIKTFLSHLYTVLWLVQLFVSYPVMVKVVFWSWETHVALCIHWVCDGKEEERFNSSNNNVSYFHYIALPVLLGLNFWKYLPSQPLLAQPELLMPTSPTLPQDFSSALTLLHSALSIQAGEHRLDSLWNTIGNRPAGKTNVQREPLNGSPLSSASVILKVVILR